MTCAYRTPFFAGEHLLHKFSEAEKLLRFSNLFAAVRLHSIANTTTGIEMLRNDGIVPPQIIDAVLADQYCTMLRNDETRM